VESLLHDLHATPTPIVTVKGYRDVAKCLNLHPLVSFLAGGSPSDGSTMSAMGDAGLIGGGFGSGGTFGAGGMPSGGFFGSSGGGPSGSGGAPGLGSSPGSVGLGAMGPGGVGTGMPGALQRRSTSTSAGLEGGAYGGSIPNPGAGSLHRAKRSPA